MSKNLLEHIQPPCVQNNAAQKVIVNTKIIFPTGNKRSQIFPINNQYEVKGIQEIASWLHSHAHICVCPSLALVGELFAMIMDPSRSSNKPGQVTNHSAQAAGNRPNLQERRQVSQIAPGCAVIDQEELNKSTC